MYFKSKVSVTSKFKYVSSSPLYTIFVAILFNTFSFTQSTKAILVRNIFTIIALFLLVSIIFYTKNGGRLIYYIAQYKHFFICFLDYLCICESLKIASIINQTKFSSTFEIIVLVALFLIKCFGTQAFLTKFRLCLRNFKLHKKMQPFRRVAGSFYIIHWVSNVLLFQIYSFGFHKYFLFCFHIFCSFY